MNTISPEKTNTKNTNLTDAAKTAATATQTVVRESTPEPVVVSPPPVDEPDASVAKPEIATPALAGMPALAGINVCNARSAKRIALGTAGALIGSAGVQTLLGVSLLTLGGGLALGLLAGVAAADHYLGNPSK